MKTHYISTLILIIIVPFNIRDTQHFWKLLTAVLLYILYAYGTLLVKQFTYNWETETEFKIECNCKSEWMLLSTDIILLLLILEGRLMSPSLGFIQLVLLLPLTTCIQKILFIVIWNQKICYLILKAMLNW